MLGYSHDKVGCIRSTSRSISTAGERDVRLESGKRGDWWRGGPAAASTGLRARRAEVPFGVLGLRFLFGGDA